MYVTYICLSLPGLLLFPKLATTLNLAPGFWEMEGWGNVCTMNNIKPTASSRVHRPFCWNVFCVSMEA